MTFSLLNIIGAVALMLWGTRMVKLGFTAVKFDPAGPYTIRGGHMPALSDISISVQFCQAIREAVGDGCDLLFGTHGQFSTAGAIRLGEAILRF